MIKLVYCIRRRADLSEDEFQRYWLEDHAPKVRSVATAIGAVRYVQSHARLPQANAGFRASRGLAEAFDGITEIWWNSPEELAAGTGTADGLAAARMLLEDERNFIDFTASSIFMTEEFEIF
ncbi:EthD domain-containing protein [Novosphingobium sp. FKTRR1]|uniref:EthD domain-containing protein n=1 Tax=Novosphingobium sp. FKTRR1 TaxID=2879118 RepID=UPI001CF02361|nr:EthD domain-containing protein [Novosphingobium sp. FKTRR1]